jgi:AraC family transcriptional regulator
MIIRYVGIKKSMIYPVADNLQVNPLDLDHATYIVHKTEAGGICWGGGLLTVKTAFSGRALFQLRDTLYSLEKGAYLILNADKDYEIIKEGYEPVELLTAYFDADFAAQVYRSLNSPAAELLADPHKPVTPPIGFFERIYRHDPVLSPRLIRIREILSEGHFSTDWLEEQVRLLLEAMLKIHLEIYAHLEDFSSIRSSLREEVYRRLYRARDYAIASLDRNIGLQDMAAVAAMSPSHFLRMFKLLFHSSPYHYLRQMRMERAGYLLRNYDLSIAEICTSVGFNSFSNFSWEFRKWYGVSPHAYRSRTG